MTDEDLQIAFVLLKRAQKIFGIKCKHPHTPEMDFVLEHIGNKKYMNQKKEKIHLLKTWKKNNWCEQIDFSDKEIYGLFKAIGEFYARKKTDDIMFRGSIDQDANFTQQEFVLAYRAEMLRDKIKRRLLSSFYVKIQGKLGTGLLPKCC